ncbi:MAG: hypothetical protein L0387_12255, partial [Acidobacteria bacterium]|nr:hypothetical protein [Acidobacteriota bacterium]
MKILIAGVIPTQAGIQSGAGGWISHSSGNLEIGHFLEWRSPPWERGRPARNCGRRSSERPPAAPRRAG